MATTTPLGLIKPAVADPIDADLWGTQWNQNADLLNTLIQTNIDAIANITTVPTGVVSDFAGASAPAGWVLCFGQELDRTTFADLFAVIGTTYGAGDGSTTFNAPDLRGRLVAGLDNMGGTSADRLTGQSGGVDGDILGASGGNETHTLVIAEMPAHDHGYDTEQAGGAGITVGGDAPGQNDTQTSSTGGDGPHNNVQPTLIMNKIIKT